MADTIVEFFAPSGLSLDLYLFLQSDPDVLVTQVGTFEGIAAAGYYFATVSDPVVGMCNALVRIGGGGAVIAGFYVLMADDTEIHRPVVQSVNNTITDISAELDDINDILEDIKARTDLLRAGQTARTPYVTPVGNIELAYGFDADITIEEAAPDDWDSDLLALGIEGSFRFHARRENSDDSMDLEAEIVGGTGTGVSNSFDVSIPRASLPERCCMYRYWIYAVSADDKHYAIVTGLIELDRGKLLED